MTREYKSNISDAFLNKLRDQVSIAEIASRWVVWDSKKSNPSRGDYWAPCPFHEESTSSFYIDDRKGFYHCFACQASGDAITFLREIQGISFNQAVRKLAYLVGLDDSDLLQNGQRADPEPAEIIILKNIIVENFREENFLEVGVLTGWTNAIRSHPRLLRSLNWGDPDFAACVLDLVTRMFEAEDGSIEKLRTYLEEHYSDQMQAVSNVSSFSGARRSLGYHYTVPRNDIIGVMMPFHPSFSPVYEAIRASCRTTKLAAKRADEVWNNSVLINDILEIINHSAVVICDLTGRNENVFYELGIAHAWGKTVIPITQNSDDVPFDLQHHRYIKYLNNSEGLENLQSNLTTRLQGLVELSTM